MRMGHEGTSSSACFVDPSKIGREKTSERENEKH